MTDTNSLEFFFDFSSPYSYFASLKVDPMAEKEGRSAVWKPVLIGAAFKQTGGRPLADVPIKGDYARHDWERMARFQDAPWQLPDPFPIEVVVHSPTPSSVSTAASSNGLG